MAIGMDWTKVPDTVGEGVSALPGVGGWVLFLSLTCINLNYTYS